MRAIILAAGTGLRMHQHTKFNNKVLLSVGRLPMIERTIRYLKQANISDITVVTGHKKELFDYLEEQYQVRCIYNTNYSIYNQLCSLEKAMDHEEDTYIIQGDVCMFKNLFLKETTTSFVYTTLKRKSGAKRRIAFCDEQFCLRKVEKSVEHLPALLGVTFLRKEDFPIFYQTMMQWVEKGNRKKDYKVEDVIANSLDSIVYQVHRLDSKYVTDVNVLEDYFSACVKYDMYFDEENNNSFVSV